MVSYNVIPVTKERRMWAKTNC